MSLEDSARLTRSASLPTQSVVLPIEKGVTPEVPLTSLARSHTVQLLGRLSQPLSTKKSS